MSDFSRRSFLQGNLAAVIAALVAERGLTPDDARPGAAFGPAAVGDPTPDPTPDPKWDGTRFTAPYTLTASSAMSQEYLLTDDVIVDADADLVAPYLRADGTIAALVIANGALCAIEPDATSSTGWSFTQIFSQPNLFDWASLIAAGVESDGNVHGAIVFGTASKAGGAQGPQLKAFMWDPADGAFYWFSDVTSDISAAMDNLTVHRALDGQLYFASFDAAGTLKIWTEDDTQFGTPLSFGDLVGQGASNPHISWSGSADPDINCGIAAMVADPDPFGDGATGIAWFQQLNLPTPPFTTFVGNAFIPDTDGLSGIVRSSDGENGPDVYCVIGTQILRFPDFGGSPSLGGDFGSPDGTARVEEFFSWGPDGSTSVIARSGTDVKVMSTLGDGTAGPVVTLEQLVTRLYGVLVPTERGTFFAVEQGTGFLSIISKDPTLGVWSRIPVRQKSATAYDLSAWRTQLTVLDVNGVPVDGASVKVTPDREVAFWQSTGSVVVTPKDGYSFTTDDRGRVTIALPVIELDAPQFTVEITDKDGVTTQSFSVSPDGAVHAYLGGTGALLGQPAFSGAALQNATDASGQPVAPNLSSDSAGAVASAMTSCIKVGTGTIDPSTKSFAIDMSGAQAVYSESSDAAAFLHLLPRNPTGGTSALMSDLHAIEHAIRKAVAKVTHVVATLASDASGWLIHLALDVGDVIDLAVDGLRSAVTAIHGILHAIGAAIDKAIEWLRMVVDGLIADTVALAAVFDDVLRTRMPGALVVFADEIDTLADGYFVSQTATINAGIASFVDSIAGVTLGNVTGAEPEGGTPPTSSPPSPPPPLLGANSDDSGFLHDVTHNWLTEKIEAEFDELLQGADGIWDDADGLLQAILTELGDVEDLAVDLAGVFWDTIKVVATPTVAKGMALQHLVDAINGLITDTLRLTDATVDFITAILRAIAGFIGDFLDQPVVGLPLLQSILTKLGHPVDLSVGRVFSLILAFPAVLLPRISEGTPLDIPPVTTAASSLTGLAGPAAVPGELWPDDDYQHWGRALGYTHASIRIVHAGADIIADIATFATGEFTQKPLRYTALLDSVASLLLLGVTWPGAPRADGKTAAPFSTDPKHGGILPMLHWLASGTGPAIGTALSSVRIGGVPVPAPAVGAIQWTAPYGWWVPVVNLMSFGATLGMGIYLDTQKLDAGKLSKPDYDIQVASTVLEITPRMATPLAAQWMNEDTYGLPLAIKVVFDIAQVASAALIIQQTITGPDD